jgi:hypothetical protein
LPRRRPYRHIFYKIRLQLSQTKDRLCIFTVCAVDCRPWTVDLLVDISFIISAAITTMDRLCIFTVYAVDCRPWTVDLLLGVSFII